MNVAARLEGLLDECPPALVGGPARARARAVVATLEGSAAELALECHLASEGARVDVVARVYPLDRERLLRRGGLPQRLEAFFRRWADPASALHGLPFVELEYDLDPSVPQPSAPEPWIGPAIEPLLRLGARAIAAARAGVAVEAWSAYQLAVASMIALGEDRAAWHRRVRDVFSHLPELGCINHLTVGAARPGSGGDERVRAIASLPRAAVHAFLTTGGFAGSLTALDALLDDVLPYEPRIDLDLEIGLQDLADRFAVYSEYRAPHPRDSTLGDLLTTLQRTGVASPAVVVALQQWVARASERVTGDASCRALTFKLLADNTGKRAAKAYLGALGLVP